MVNDVIKDLEGDFQKAIENFKAQLGKVRTGRANVSLLDGIKVEYYGTPTPLHQVATLNVPDPRLITIKPWDRTLIPAIEKAIKARSELGLNPAADGELVRLPIPPLTQDRRKELAKVLKGMAEDSRVVLRNSRRDANEMLKQLSSDGEITEDDSAKGLKRVQELTDKYIAQVDDI